MWSELDIRKMIFATGWEYPLFAKKSCVQCGARANLLTTAQSCPACRGELMSIGNIGNLYESPLIGPKGFVVRQGEQSLLIAACGQHINWQGWFNEIYIRTVFAKSVAEEFLPRVGKVAVLFDDFIPSDKIACYHLVLHYQHPTIRVVKNSWGKNNYTFPATVNHFENEMEGIFYNIQGEQK